MQIEIKKPRKLQGWENSCLVCLPRTWLDSHALNRGDKVKMTIMENGALMITKEVQNETTKA